MAKTEEVVEETEQTEVQSAEGQTKEQAEQTAEGGQEQKTEETVPKARFKEMEAKAKIAEEQNALLAQQQAIIAANRQKPAEQKPFDIYAEVGAEDDEDMLTVGQQKKIDAYRESRHQAQMAELQFLSTHPDYNEIVGTDEGIRVGKFAAPLAKAIKENPALQQVILSHPNMREAAYQIARTQIEKPTEKIETTDAKDAIDEAVKNARKVKSSSNVAGGGVLSEEGRIATMTEDAFLELARSHGAPI